MSSMPTGMRLLLEWWWLLPLALGLVLLILARRGKRVGRDPHCRRCRYNLTGSPDAPTCPECGADLSSPRTIRLGERRRRPVFLVTAMVLLTIGLLPLALRLHAVNVYPYLPNVVLNWTIDHEAARQEIIQRMAAGKFTGAACATAVTTALDVQGDRARSWEDSWGQIIEAAASVGSLAPTDALRYMQQAGDFELRVRSPVQRGRKPGGFVWGTNAGRVGPNTKVNAVLNGQAIRIADRNVELPHRMATDWSKITWEHNGFSSSASHLPLEAAGAERGRSTIEVDFTPKYTLMVNGQTLAGPVDGPSETCSAVVEAVDHTTGQYLSLNQTQIAERAAAAHVWIRIPRGGNDLRLTLGLRSIDRQTNPRVFVRVDGSWVDANTYNNSSSWTEHNGLQVVHYDLDLERLRKQFKDARTVDILVRPDVKSAETSPWIEPTWLGELVFLAVPLDAQPHDENQTNTWRAEQFPPSLVPAKARALTFEEAETPPK
jgi:hypothetical protein